MAPILPGPPFLTCPSLPCSGSAPRVLGGAPRVEFPDVMSLIWALFARKMEVFFTQTDRKPEEKCKTDNLQRSQDGKFHYSKHKPP